MRINQKIVFLYKHMFQAANQANAQISFTCKKNKKRVKKIRKLKRKREEGETLGSMKRI